MQIRRAPDRLIPVLTRAFPTVWRRRYEIEFLAMVAARPATWRDVLDVTTACVVEHSSASGRGQGIARQSGLLVVRAIRTYCAAMLCLFVFAYAVSFSLQGRVEALPAAAFTFPSLAAAAAYMLRFFIVLQLLFAIVLVACRVAGQRLPRGWARRGIVLAIVAVAIVVDAKYLGDIGVGMSRSELDVIFADYVLMLQVFIWMPLLDPAVVAGHYDDDPDRPTRISEG